MPPTNQPVVNVAQIVQALAVYRWRWIVPTVLLTLLALAYALVRPVEWRASQALLLRDEAIGGRARPGSFEELDRMKVAQETVLQLATSRPVIAAALADLGPVRGGSSNWPTALDVESARGDIALSAPNGAAFGTTEVFYLKVTNGDRQRAAALTDAVCRRLDEHILKLRSSKADSLVTELTNTVDLAQADLDEATARLSELERELGPDLSELRLLTEASSGESNLRRTLVEISTELREAQAAVLANQQLLAVLKAARRDPANLVATPGKLLAAQPALHRLKDGLVDAQLLTSRLLGQMTPQHPKVQSAAAAEQQIRQSLFGELETAIRGLQIDLELGEARTASLEVQLAEVQQRIDRVVRVRADYGNLLDEVRHRGDTLEVARQKLAAARASKQAAAAASLITRIDEPIVGDHPLGPRKAVVVLAGLFGGLMTGWGLLFLTVPVSLLQAEKPAASPAKNPLHRPALPRRTAAGGLWLKEVVARISRAVGA